MMVKPRGQNVKTQPFYLVLANAKIRDEGMSFVRDLYPATPVGVRTIVGDIRPNSQ